MQVYLGKKKIKLSPQKMIGKGGEAEIYALNPKEVIKLFKTPQHLDFSQDPDAQQAAGDRLKEHQLKLKQFPQGLPNTVLKPLDFVRDAQGGILGYTMPYLNAATPLYRYGDRRFREQNGISQRDITQLFIQIHQTLSTIHQASVVVGDFNDLNILVEQKIPYFIDTDSWQFSSFQCQLFTARFVDPLLCEQTALLPQLIMPHNAKSDWYAFAVMLFRSLLYVEPYGGIYPDTTIPHSARSLRRISVFHPKVKYPKPALPYKILSDDLLHYFQGCFDRDLRQPLPLKILQDLNWKTCPHCGQIHSKNNCPDCQIQVPISPLIKATQLRQIFSTKGTILATEFRGQTAHYLYWENGEFKRETGQVVFRGDRHPALHFWVQGSRTYVGQGDTVLCFEGGEVQAAQTLRVETYQQQPIFCCGNNKRYWLEQGKLWRDGSLGADCIGDVLAAQTRFWLENGWGFGFYQVGNLLTGFIFDANRHGINDQVQLPRIFGEIIEVDCTIGEDIWLFLSVQHQGQLQQHLWVGDRQGRRKIHQIFTLNELPTLAGHCATEDGLLMATDQGIAHWLVQQGKLQIQYPYPDLTDLVESHQTIQSHNDHLYLMDRQNLWQLR